MVVVVCLVPYQIPVVQAWFRCLLDAIAGGGGEPYQMDGTGRPAPGQLGRLASIAGALTTLNCMDNLNISIDLKFESETSPLITS